MDILGFVALVVTGFTSCAEFGSYAFVHPVIRVLPAEQHVQVEQGLSEDVWAHHACLHDPVCGGGPSLRDPDERARGPGARCALGRSGRIYTRARSRRSSSMSR